MSEEIKEVLMRKTAVLLSFFAVAGVFAAVSHVKHMDTFLGPIINNFIPKTTLEYWLENTGK